MGRGGSKRWRGETRIGEKGERGKGTRNLYSGSREID